MTPYSSAQQVFITFISQMRRGASQRLHLKHLAHIHAACKEQNQPVFKPGLAGSRVCGLTNSAFEIGHDNLGHQHLSRS